MGYHSDLPETWIEIIEKDEVLKAIWEEHDSEYEAVPEFLFGSLYGKLEHLKPILALYGDAGLELYDKLQEVESLFESAREGNENQEAAEQLTREYIQAMNKLYEDEFGGDPILDEDAEIVFVPANERSKVESEIRRNWYDTLECEMNDEIGDWYVSELDCKEDCEELKDLIWESLYNLIEDYHMSYYLVWSLADRPAEENPYISYYKLWRMGLRARFVEENKVMIV